MLQPLRKALLRSGFARAVAQGPPPRALLPVAPHLLVFSANDFLGFLIAGFIGSFPAQSKVPKMPWTLRVFGPWHLAGPGLIRCINPVGHLLQGLAHQLIGELRLATSGRQELIRCILSWMPGVEVLEPTELQNPVAEKRPQGLARMK